MSKGQSTEKKLKNILKYFKMNEDTISTLMGIVVIVLIAGLIFNYFKSTNLKTWQGMLLDQQAPATTSELNQDDKQVEKNLAIYTVVKGDDLWHISEKFYKSGYNYVDIMKENKIVGDGSIEVGMELIIPKVDSKKITVIETKSEVQVTIPSEPIQAEVKDQIASNDNSPTSSIDTGEYVTKRGDSLWSIAVRAYGDGYKWTKIYWENNSVIGNPDIIHADVKLNIPNLSK